MSDITRILPSAELTRSEPSKLKSKQSFLDFFSCDFRDGVQASTSGLLLEGNEQARGLVISARGVRRYFRLLIEPPSLQRRDAVEVELWGVLRARPEGAAVTAGLAFFDPAKGWSWFEGQSQQLTLHASWSELHANLVASNAGGMPVAVLLQFEADVVLEIAQLDFRQAPATSLGGTLEFVPVDARTQLPKGDDAARSIKLASAQADFHQGTLQVSARLEARDGLPLSGLVVELMADAFVLQRGTLIHDGAAFGVELTTACSPKTCERGLRLRAPALEVDWPLALGATEAALAPALVEQADRVEGGFDGVFVNPGGTLVARGWARDPDRPGAAVALDLFVDGAYLGTGYATALRPSVVAKLGGSPVCGYSLDVPANLTCGQQLSFEAKPRTKSRNIEFRAESVRLPPFGERLEEDSKSIDLLVPTAQSLARPRTYAGIILTRDAAELVRDLLQSIERHEPQSFGRLIVIDHESSDHTREVVAEFEGRLPVELIVRPKDCSFSASNNFGASLAREDTLLFINNDIVFSEPILEAMGSALTDEVGLVGIKLLDPPPPHSSLSLRTPQHVGIHFHAHARGNVLPFESRLLTDAPPANHAAIETPGVTAALVAVDREFFESLGGFDESYFYGWEDSDLCLRAMARGRKNLCLNQISAVHVRGYTRRRMPPALAYRRSLNAVTFRKEWTHALVRSMLGDTFTRPGFWSGRDLHVGFVVSETGERATTGDTMTALDFARALVRHVPCKAFFFDKRESVDATAIDILVVMTDDFDVRTVENLGLTTRVVAWARNWFHRWAARPWRERYDLWFASSERAVEYLQGEFGRKVTLLPIATDPERFARGGNVDGSLASDVTFTGHYWGSPRDVVNALEPSRYDLKVFGKGWEQVSRLRPYHRGSLEYGRLVDAYTSTKIVVDDANFATCAWGALNSRVYDALAAGALVVTNNELGSREEFDGKLPTYSDRASLTRVIEKYLQSPREREQLVKDLRARVLERHTYEVRARTFVEAIETRTKSGLRIAIKLSAPSLERTEGWGDWYFAQSLRRELEELGHSVRIDCLADWQAPAVNRDDVNLVLRGLEAFPVPPNQLNIMWLISHPDKVSVEELNGYDRVYVASRLFATELATRCTVPLEFLPQCTDERSFHLPATGTSRSGTVFVANSRLVSRPVVQAAIAHDVAIEVHGDGWQGLIPEAFVKSRFLSNERVGELYGRSEIVLNDHWQDMKARGFISNRLFDAVACGAAVVTDEVDGLGELFGSTVRTFSDEASFASAVKQLRTTPPSEAERQSAAERVLENHTFKARARTLDESIRRLSSERLRT